MRAHLAILAAIVMTVSGTGVVTAGGSSRVDPVVAFDSSTARVTWNGGALIVRAAGSPIATASAFLASRGATARTLASLRVERTHTWLGVTHVTFHQEVDGLRVAGAYAKLAFDESGALINVIDHLVAVPASVGSTAVPAEAALHTAIAAVIPQLVERPAVAARAAGLVTFARTPAFAQAPTARQVLVARESGRLERAWQVTTWTSDNLLDVTLVDAAGLMAGTERRTASDSYTVYEEDPRTGTTTVSDTNWLYGNTQKTTNIVGNFVNAYLDRNADNTPDSGGASVSGGTFSATFDPTVQPDTTSNQAFAVQNLFYLNSRVHDLLYTHGFTESAGNFQRSNGANGGLGGDPVLAEAQDGSGMDNANMSTPADGSSPRMQMYLWSSPDPSHDVDLPGNGPIIDAYGASFGPKLTTAGVNGTLVMVNDGSGTTGDACQSMPRGSLKSKIAIIDRGFCSFVTKVANAASAGAIGAIVVNNVADAPFTMGGSTSVKIPSVMVAMGQRKSLTDMTTNTNLTAIRLRTPAPTMLDGDLDSDIVFHEYAHGLTWRMIGSMSGGMSGAIGEGASDALAMFINKDPAIGEYSMDNTVGIRTATYDNITKTYASMTSGEVHDDGEVYGRIAWLLLQGYGNASVSALLTTWVDGMNYTPAGPNVKDMRDGMLKSAGLRTRTSECTTIRDKFAQVGAGENSSVSYTPRGGWKPTNGFNTGSGCL